MVTGERFPVDVEQFIARCHDDRRPQLGRPATRIALPVAAGERSGPGEERIRPDQRHRAETVRLDDVCGLPVLVEEHGEGHFLIVNERFGVSPTARADRSDARPDGLEVFVAVADLTGPLTTGQSAEVPKEEKYVRIGGPQIPQAVQRAFRVWQGKVREFGCGERHPGSLSGG